MTMSPLVRHQCSTCAVEASSGKTLMVNRVLDNGKATKPLLKTPHRNSICMSSTAAFLLLCTPLEWDVAHIVPEDEEAVGKMFGMFSPRGVPCFPAAQHATTTEALHPVALPYVVEAGLGQISGSHRSSRGPRREGLKPGLLIPHVRDHWVGGFINHFSCPQTIFHVFRFFIVCGTVRYRVKTGAVGAP